MIVGCIPLGDFERLGLLYLSLAFVRRYRARKAAAARQKHSPYRHCGRMRHFAFFCRRQHGKHTRRHCSSGPQYRRASPPATMFLSDHGARVIRIVAPNDQNDARRRFIVWDRGKELLKLIFNDAAKNRDNANLFCRLVKGADVLIDDFAPSSPCQTLVDAAWLRSLNPRLVSCSITAFGKRALEGRAADRRSGSCTHGCAWRHARVFGPHLCALYTRCRRSAALACLGCVFAAG